MFSHTKRRYCKFFDYWKYSLKDGTYFAKEDSDEKNIVYHKRYSHYRRDSAGVFYGLFVDTKQYCGKCADPGSIYFWSLSDFCDHTGVSVWCGSCNSQRS